MASTQLLLVIMIISIVAILGLTFFLIRSDNISFKYKINTNPNDIPHVFVKGKMPQENFKDPTTYSNYKYKCNDVNVLCKTPWKCINGNCELCTEVQLGPQTKCVTNQHDKKVCMPMESCETSNYPMPTITS